MRVYGKLKTKKIKSIKIVVIVNLVPLLVAEFDIVCLDELFKPTSLFDCLNRKITFMFKVTIITYGIIN